MKSGYLFLPDFGDSMHILNTLNFLTATPIVTTIICSAAAACTGLQKKLPTVDNTPSPLHIHISVTKKQQSTAQF